MLECQALLDVMAYNCFMNIGINIKELRINLNMTQKQLAQALDVSFQAISEWENNKSRPEYENLVKMAQLFDVSTDYLLGLEK